MTCYVDFYCVLQCGYVFVFVLFIVWVILKSDKVEL